MHMQQQARQHSMQHIIICMHLASMVFIMPEHMQCIMVSMHTALQFMHACGAGRRVVASNH